MYIEAKGKQAGEQLECSLSILGLHTASVTNDISETETEMRVTTDISRLAVLLMYSSVVASYHASLKIPG